jgi:hypothetical protein
MDFPRETAAAAAVSRVFAGTAFHLQPTCLMDSPMTSDHVGGPAAPPSPHRGRGDTGKIKNFILIRVGT